MQMAGELSLVDLIVLGYELCGTYRLENAAQSEQGFRNDEPLTSVAKLRSYVAKIVNQKGRKKALRALQYIADNSASPMETILTMLLTLPYRLGGYGFKMPSLNYPVKVSHNAGRATDRNMLRCDLCWLDEKVVAEYDSDAYHTGAERIRRDAIRRNALTSAGMTMVTVSSVHVSNKTELEELALALSKLLGKRLKCPQPEFSHRQAELRKQILPKVPIAGY